MNEIPDKVYSIWGLTGIKAHKVMGWFNNRLAIRHNGSNTAGAKPLSDGTFEWGSYIYYPTWEAAHTAALAKCNERIKQAEKEIKSSQRAIKKLEGMKENLR